MELFFKYHGIYLCREVKVCVRWRTGGEEAAWWVAAPQRQRTPAKSVIRKIMVGVRVSGRGGGVAGVCVAGI